MASLNRDELLLVYRTCAQAYVALGKRKTKDNGVIRHNLKCSAMAIETCIGQIDPIPVSEWK